MTFYAEKINAKGYTIYKYDGSKKKIDVNVATSDKYEVLKALTGTIKTTHSSDIGNLATALNADKGKLYNYMKWYDNTYCGGGDLTNEDMANALLYGLDNTDGSIDGKFDSSKMNEAIELGSNKFLGVAKSENSSEHDTKEGEHAAKAEVKMQKRDKVSAKQEDQNATKASLKSEDGKTKYHTDWTAYAKRLNGDQDIASVEQLISMFGITKPAAEAIMEKAKSFNASNITDGVGQVLQDIDKNDGAHDGKITIGKFNDYVEKLMETSSEAAKKLEKPSKGGGGGGGSSSKVEINNGAETEALKEEICELKKEIEALKKDKKTETTTSETTPSKKKNNTWLYVGAAALAAGAAYLLLKKEPRRDAELCALPPRPQPFCSPPVPYCSPPLAFQGQFQGQLQGPANRTMFA